MLAALSVLAAVNGGANSSVVMMQMRINQVDWTIII
jgi:hypothetical protein